MRFTIPWDILYYVGYAVGKPYPTDLYAKLELLDFTPSKRKVFSAGGFQFRVFCISAWNKFMGRTLRKVNLTHVLLSLWSAN